MVRDVVVAKELAVHAAMWGIQKQGIMGIPGDEDGGGMTAFVVFSSIGLYPVTPGLPEYSIGSPLFEKSQISLGNGKTFTVVARGVSEKPNFAWGAR